ncbi:nuclear transport factor 2 family protein [Sphingomonas sp. Leaf23]|uniref:nuclear transport factor 2 family protein n=1 Tax=Sphingomonas sp. Leaf23 TaxID=1735689 RepID=UPI000AE2AC78|nr:nuclear transport factor 2 family protein [Sphingomonas sp. Leaf23]
MTDRVQDFSAMLRDALGDSLATDTTSFVDMLAKDALMEFPFAPPGLPRRIEGRGAVADHLAKLARLIAFDRIGPAQVIARDGETTVLAFEATGTGVETGAPYDQRYLSVITTVGGQIVRYLDYWDPLVVARALLGDDAANAITMDGVYGG